MTPSRSAMPAGGRFLLPVAALLLCAAQLTLTFPGELNDDSTEQLRQALSHQFGDWHPPVMALVWSWLIRVTGTPGSLLIVQQALHWLGFGLLADACRRADMPKRAWLILAAGAFPVFLFYDRLVVKDVEMGSAYVAAFGLCCWFLLVRRTLPKWVIAISSVLLLYGTLTRTNAVFALGPLICLFFARGRRLGVVPLTAVAIAVALIAVPLAGAINHRLIDARRQDSLQSLQVYDMVGIEVRSGDERVLGPKAPAFTAVKSCYTAYWWDTFSTWGACAKLRGALPYVADMREVTPVLMADRASLWRAAITAHPVDYALHRLSYFNSSIYFLVPSLHFRFSQSTALGANAGHVVTPHDIHMDYLKKNVFFWPVFWLSIGCGALLLLSAAPQVPLVVALARLLITSGLLYSGAYLLVGVATDVRYYYWTIMSILIGCILALPDLRSAWREYPVRAAVAAVLLLAVLVGGYAARLADVHFV